MQSTGDSDGLGENARKRNGNPITRQRLGWDDLRILVLFLCFVLAVEGIASSFWSWSVNGMSVSDNGKPLSGWGVFATRVICSGAASLVGGLLGFLFAIPRSVESSTSRLPLNNTTTVARPEVVISEAAPVPPSKSSATRFPAAAERPPLLRVNTNLEDISDLVTKVLLGAGLAQAGQLVDGAGRLAAFLGLALVPAPPAK